VCNPLLTHAPSVTNTTILSPPKRTYYCSSLFTDGIDHDWDKQCLCSGNWLSPPFGLKASLCSNCSE
ncbi:unnamed protein product, partial [Hymenolepis diminuta]